MKNSKLIVIIFTFYFADALLADESCPKRNMSADRMYFQTNMKIKVPVIEGQYFSINCCMDGYKRLEWYMYSLPRKRWQKPFQPQYFDNNRTIAILNPSNGDSSGSFYCFGTDNENNRLNGSTFVNIFSSKNSRNLESVSPISAKVDYQIGETAQLSCKANTYYPNDDVMIYWEVNYPKNGTAERHLNSTSKYSIHTKIHRNYQENLFWVFIETYLTIYSLNTADTANYSCVFTQNSITTQLEFSIKVHALSLIILCSTMGIMAALGITVFTVWLNIYRLIVFFKKHLDCYPETLFDNNQQYDISILYPEMDMSCVAFARQMCHTLESRHYKCWLMERNKIFGQEIRLSIQEIAYKSSLVLIIMSKGETNSINTSEPDSLSILRSLIALQSGLAIKKLYIFNPSYKVFKTYIKKEDFNLSLSFKTELRIQRLCCLSNYQNIDIESVQRNQNDSEALIKVCDNYIPWIIASLPTNIIRRVKNNDTL